MPVSSQTSNARFVMRFDAVYPGVANRTLNGGASYDAFYASAYAIFSLGAAAITGPSMARAFGRLGPPGAHVEVGPSGVLDALSSLARGDKVDLEGASGALDFVAATGEVAVDAALVCSGVDDSGLAQGDVESGLVYRARDQKIEGAMRCP
jgi:hypothetical protein